jgi:hypothetical protein
MTVFKSTDGLVVGQPINPNFGAANGAVAPGVNTVQIPPGMPALEAMSRGILPRNQMVQTVNGVSVGGTINGIGTDNCTAAELFTNGNGAPCVGGVPPVGGANGANDQQQFVVGTNANAQIQNGPTTFNTDPLTLAPVSVNTNGSALGLSAGAFGG